MPADPPDLGFAFLLLGLRHVLQLAETIAARRPRDQVIAAAVAELRAIVVRVEQHPEASRQG